MIPALDEKLRRELDSFAELPSMPEVTLRIKEIADNPRASAVDLANCVLSDHHLTTRVLKVANSAFYGDLAGKTSTVTHAIVLMGFKAVQNIALSMAVLRVVDELSHDGAFDRVSFWTRSVACGVTTRYLAECVGGGNSHEAAFVAGFLHDIGQPVLAALFPGKYGRIRRPDPDRDDVCRNERLLMGVDHAAVGEYLGTSWNLPRNLVDVISRHHRPGLRPAERSNCPLVDLVYLADRLYPFLAANVDPNTEAYVRLTEQAEALAGVSKGDMEALLEICRKRATGIADDFEIDIHKEFFTHCSVEVTSDTGHQQGEQVRRHLDFLFTAHDKLMEAGSSGEMLDITCEAVYHGLQLGRVLLFRYEATGHRFVGTAGFGMPQPEKVRALSFPAGEGLFRYIVETARPLRYTPGAFDQQGLLMTPEEREQLDLRSLAAVPVKKWGRAVMVLVVESKDRGVPVSEDTVRALECFANQVGLVLERNHTARAGDVCQPG